MRLRYNHLHVALGSGLNSVATSIVFDGPLQEGGVNIPTVASPNYLPLSIDDEVLWLTAYTAGDTGGTVVRECEDTAAAAHDVDAEVHNAPTKLDFQKVPTYFAALAGGDWEGYADVVCPAVGDCAPTINAWLTAHASQDFELMFAPEYFPCESALNTLGGSYNQKLSGVQSGGRSWRYASQIGYEGATDVDFITLAGYGALENLSIGNYAGTPDVTKTIVKVTGGSVEMRGIHLYGDSEGGSGLRLIGFVSLGQFRDIYFQDCNFEVDGSGSGNVFQNEFEGFYFQGASVGSLDLAPIVVRGRTSYNRFSKFLVDAGSGHPGGATWDAGLYLVATASNRYPANNTFDDIYLNVGEADCGLYVDGGEGNRFTNWTHGLFDCPLIKVRATLKHTMKNIWGDWAGNNSNPSGGIDILAGATYRITQNKFHDLELGWFVAGHGVLLDGALITANVFSSIAIADAAVAATYDMFHLIGASSNIISNCVPGATAGGSNWRYGATLSSGTATDNIFSACNFKAGCAAGFNDLGTNTLKTNCIT